MADAHFQALYAHQARGRGWILEYGKRMRRINDTECIKMCELQHTHKQCTESKVAKRTGEAGREREKGFGVSPDCDTTQHTHANNKPSAVEKGGGGGLWLCL